MVAPLMAPFLSPRTSAKLHDCRQHATGSSSHALPSIASPVQTRTQNCPISSSPTNRRTVRTCPALPFGFPSFGFPSFGSLSGSGQPGKGGSSGYDNGNAEEKWIRSSEAPPSKGCNTDATIDGVNETGATPPGGGSDDSSSSSSAVGGPTSVPTSPQQPNARRRLNLPSLPFAQAATVATSASESATTATVITYDAMATGLEESAVAPPPPTPPQPPPTELYPNARGEQSGGPQQQEGAGSGSPAAGRRGSPPLPYPWSLSEEEDGAGAEMSGPWWSDTSGWDPAAANASPPELDVRQLSQMLRELCGYEDDQPRPRPRSLHGLHRHTGPGEADRWMKDRDTGPGLWPEEGCPRTAAPLQPRPGEQWRQRQWQLQRQRVLLDQIHSGLVGGKLRPKDLWAVPGLLPFLTEVMAIGGEPGPVGQSGGAGIMYGNDFKNSSNRWQVVPERGVNASTGVALECLCMLLAEETLPAGILRGELESQLVAAVEATVGVLRSARLPSAVMAPAHNPAPSLLAAPATATSSYPSPVPVAKGTDWIQSRSDGGTALWSDGTAEAYGWSADVSAAFFAASVLVRAARFPLMAEAAVAAGGLGLLVRLMTCRPAMLAQMAVFATYKFVRHSPPFAHAAQAAEHPRQQGDVSMEAAHEIQHQQQQQQRDTAEREREWREAVLLAVAQSGGLGALCGCLEALEDRPSRDMASSIMLDMALVPQVPAIVAGLSHVQPLVGVMRSRRCDPIARMYALLVLARLCNHSAECQMDAVREGAVEPLLALVRTGSEEEQTHACRLLAILGQAVPTHGRIKASGAVQAVLPLLRELRGSGAVVAEHATSVLAVLAQNPDMHFHIVGCGAVPAMMPILSSGTEKARTYVLATLMLLCEQEERHAAVVVRAGALPMLVSMVATVAAPQNPSAAALTAAAVAAASGPSSPSSATPQCAVASTQEFAAAVLCSLSRYVGVQPELLACGALSALVRCLGQGPPEAAINAAEGLVHLAAGNKDAKRAVVSDPAASRVLLRLLSHSKPTARYWSLQLLRAISTDDVALRMVAGLPEQEDDRGEDDGEEEKGKERSATAAAKGPSAIRRRAEELAASFGLRLPPPAVEVATLRRKEVGALGGNTVRVAELVNALVRLLRWPEGQAASWQQGRCRVLAGWLLARMCGLRQVAPSLLASGAVRELMVVLAEEQQRQEELAAAAAAAAAAAEADGLGAKFREALGGGMALPPQLPLLPGEGEAGGVDSGFDADENEESGAAPAEGPHGGTWSEGPMPPMIFGSSSISESGASSYPRRVRFDINAAAAAAAALMSVARTGRDGRMAVLSELTLLHWMGISVRLEGLDKA